MIWLLFLGLLVIIFVSAIIYDLKNRRKIVKKRKHNHADTLADRAFSESERYNSMNHHNH